MRFPVVGYPKQGSTTFYSLGFPTTHNPSKCKFLHTVESTFTYLPQGTELYRVFGSEPKSKDSPTSVGHVSFLLSSCSRCWIHYGIVQTYNYLEEQSYPLQNSFKKLVATGERLKKNGVGNCCLLFYFKFLAVCLQLFHFK